MTISALVTQAIPLRDLINANSWPHLAYLTPLRPPAPRGYTRRKENASDPYTLQTTPKPKRTGRSPSQALKLPLSPMRVTQTTILHKPPNNQDAVPPAPAPPSDSGSVNQFSNSKSHRRPPWQ